MPYARLYTCNCNTLGSIAKHQPSATSHQPPAHGFNQIHRLATKWPMPLCMHLILFYNGATGTKILFDSLTMPRFKPILPGIVTQPATSSTHVYGPPAGTQTVHQFYIIQLNIKLRHKMKYGHFHFVVGFTFHTLPPPLPLRMELCMIPIRIYSRWILLYGLCCECVSICIPSAQCRRCRCVWFICFVCNKCVFKPIAVIKFVAKSK